MRQVCQFAFAWLLTLLYATAPALAQCAMCIKAVESAGTRVIDVVKVGIYILLVPTVLIFGALALMVYRRRKHHMPEPPESQLPSGPIADLPSSAR